jgi:serine protease Do
MRKLGFGVLLGCLALFAGQGVADSLKLSGNKKWLVVASTKDIDSAIGIARNLGEGAQVVTSQSGYFGVIKGPYAASTIDAVKKLDSSLYEVPKDALLSNGIRYVKSVWKAPTLTAFVSTYQIDKPAHLSSGDISVEVKLDKMGENQYATVVSGEEKSGPDFTFTVAKEDEYSPSNADAGFVKLDPTSDVPQLVFSRYTGGAHCCTNTWIATKPHGAAGWSLTDAGKLDGGGFYFEDVDGDGYMELMSADNSFLYAFDSYAGSFAPVKISQLRAGTIEDVSDHPEMQVRLKQELAGMEYAAKVDPALWKSNGFLAGWAANKLRLGQGEEAWQTVVENIDSKSEFGPQECLTGQKIDDCPAEQLKPIPILKALAEFLKENGYGPLPDAAEALLG